MWFAQESFEAMESESSGGMSRAAFKLIEKLGLVNSSASLLTGDIIS
jgi:hypothetical protein